MPFFLIINFKQNLENIMSYHNARWFDVVSHVQRANIQDERLMKNKQREINQKYLERNFDEMQKHNIQKIQRLNDIKQERNKVEKLARDEIQRRKIDKSIKMARELMYQQENKKIIENIRKAGHHQQPFIENKFLKLIQESDKRKEAFRSRLKMQNQINSLQSQMKQVKRKEQIMNSKQFMQDYSNKIENFYDQRNQNREQFKNRYLKLNIFEEKSIKSDKAIAPKAKIQQDYVNFLNHQVKSKQEDTRKREMLDQQLSKFNQNIDYPDSSPAFLGRNPLNHDRKKQLFYLDRSLNKLIQPLNYQRVQRIHRFKTQVPSIYEAGNLNQINKTYEITLRNQSKSQAAETINQNNMQFNETTPQTCELIQAKKQYMKYDIIQGRKKLIPI